MEATFFLSRTAWTPGLLSLVTFTAKPHAALFKVIESNMTELMERIVQRDARALETLYERFSKALYCVILPIVKKKEDAEEILCEIFQQVWEKASSYDVHKGSVYTWLLKMARNRAIDKIRSKGYKNQSLESSDVEDMDDFVSRSTENPLDNVLLSERAEMVKAALSQISPDQRLVLETAYFEGYTQSQIAERLRLPLGTVKTRMRDGMKSLQGQLKEVLTWP
jgi:RNA polymerase sigma-70 factor (ECF subfamily)